MLTVNLQKHGHPREDWKNETCDAEMYVQDVVEKKLTNLAYISTKQNKADLMTKCHTFETHKRGCVMIGLSLA